MQRSGVLIFAIVPPCPNAVSMQQHQTAEHVRGKRSLVYAAAVKMYGQNNGRH
jgi:hypothetical protein